MTLVDAAPRTRATARLTALEPGAGPLPPDRLARVVTVLAADTAGVGRRSTGCCASTGGR